jgi:hypothetical protein
MKKFKEGSMFTSVVLLRVAGEDRQHDHLDHLSLGAKSSQSTRLSQRQSVFSRKGKKWAVSIK